MKNNINIFAFLSILVLIFSCTDKWDDHYKGDSESGEVVLDSTFEEFFKANSEYSEFYRMLEVCGVDSVFDKDQQITLWVADNESMMRAGIADNDTLRMKYHVNNLPFLRTDLKTGLRIQTLNGIYLDIKRSGEDVYVNNSKIEKSYRLKDGVVHIIDELLQSKINLFDFIQSLPDDYSIFRDSIMFYNENRFDEANSIPTGVDATGNTEYDSVFVVYNPLFNKAEFNSEFEQFTAFIPSNEVINDCLTKLNEQFASMGRTVTQEDTISSIQWIKEAAFYKGVITDFSEEDLISTFDRVWRNSIQKVDQSRPVEMSNGIGYYVTDFKIPTNYILDRIKSLIHYWEYLTEEEKEDDVNFYKFVNATKVSVPTEDKMSSTPKPEILPYYVWLDIQGDYDNEDEFYVEFPPLERYEKEDGTYGARIMEVPTGDYDLYMGVMHTNHPYVDIYFDGELIKANTPAFDATPWHYDRNNETEYDRYIKLGLTGGTAKWDGLGGHVGKVRVGAEGESGLKSFRIKMKFNKTKDVGNEKVLKPYHWCLKPADSNY